MVHQVPQIMHYLMFININGRISGEQSINTDSGQEKKSIQEALRVLAAIYDVIFTNS